MVFPAVKVMALGTAALGAVGVFIVPAAAVSTDPVPAVERIVNGRLNTTVLAVAAVFIA